MYPRILYKSSESIKAYLIIFLFAFIGSFLSGCTKLVEVESPPTALTSGNIYSDDATAASVLTNIYTLLSTNTPVGGQWISSISLAAGLSADELTLDGGAANFNALLTQFYLNSLTVGQPTSSAFSMWNDFYSKLYIVNIAIENLAVSNNLTFSVKQQLLGEAKFMRAFFYFYLVNLYGDVPLTTTSNYIVNDILSRSSKTFVYQQIDSDLKDAQELLTSTYVSANAMTGTTERVRPNKWAATALLARTYLYEHKWDSAEMEATQVINNSALYQLNTVNGVFLKNSTEAIWQLQPVNAEWNTEDARVFILPPTGPTSSSYPVYLSPQLLASFKPGDLRRTDWIDSVILNGTIFYYPFKYKSATLNAQVTEYLMILRLGEQYLIRAEARAEQNNIGGAQSDLNTIRSRAGLPNTTANDNTSLLTAILHERQVELFTEWGNRWLDLKRTGNVDAVMNSVAPAKGTSWSTNWQLYPIPLYDITQDPNLVQNAGY